ncbi:MAG: class I SAM-dependent methyltransferase [Anaerolineae bacterium]
MTKENVEGQFSRVAKHYTTSAVHAKGEDLDAMVVAARLSGSELVLDAGCGAGHTALAFAPRVAEVWAYDLSRSMLDQVESLAQQRQITNVKTFQGDVERLPFDAQSVDLVVSRYSAHHWWYPEMALREFAHVLKPGGQFILSDVVSYDDYIEDTFLQAIELLRDPSHVRDHRVEEWQAMFAEAGFKSEVVLRFGVHLGFKSWLTRMATPDLNATLIRTLLAQAPQEVQAVFRLPKDWQTLDDFEFVLPGVVLRGTLA